RHGPRKKKGDFQIENDKQDSDQVIAHIKLHARIFESFEAAFVRGEFFRIGIPVPQQAAGHESDADHDSAENDANRDKNQNGYVVLQHALRYLEPVLVRMVRLELTRLTPLPPQDSVSTNSTTSALS